jgi:hypothetical protein
LHARTTAHIETIHEENLRAFENAELTHGRIQAMGVIVDAAQRRNLNEE